MADQIFYVTFGAGQDPGLGYYNRVYAKDIVEASQKMYKRLGNNKWAFIYTSEEEAGVERHNLELWETIV